MRTLTAITLTSLLGLAPTGPALLAFAVASSPTDATAKPPPRPKPTKATLRAQKAKRNAEKARGKANKAEAKWQKLEGKARRAELAKAFKDAAKASKKRAKLERKLAKANGKQNKLNARVDGAVARASAPVSWGGQKVSPPTGVYQTLPLAPPGRASAGSINGYSRAPPPQRSVYDRPPQPGYGPPPRAPGAASGAGNNAPVYQSLRLVPQRQYESVSAALQ